MASQTVAIQLSLLSMVMLSLPCQSVAASYASVIASGAIAPTNRLLQPLDAQQQPLREHRHWLNYIDRRYMKDIMFPRVGAQVGPTGKVLSIGFRPEYNRNDRIYANVSSDRWFISELQPMKVPADVGVFIAGSFDALYNETRYHGFFDAIVDYGVLGVPEIRIDENTTIRFCRTYAKLLASNGRLYFKVDIASFTRAAAMWARIQPLLMQELRPAYRLNMQSPGCPPHTRRAMMDVEKLSKDEEVVQYSEFSGYDFTVKSYNGNAKCDGYLLTEWVKK